MTAISDFKSDNWEGFGENIGDILIESYAG